jgi:hypothetical protein
MEIGPSRPEAELGSVERWLRAARPRPRPGFVENLERSLLGDPTTPRPRPRAARRPLLAAAAASAAITAATLGLSVAGVGPLAGGSEQDVNATSSCHFVSVKERARVPQVVTGARGQARIVYRYTLVERRVKRCD